MQEKFAFLLIISKSIDQIALIYLVLLVASTASLQNKIQKDRAYNAQAEDAIIAEDGIHQWRLPLPMVIPWMVYSFEININISKHFFGPTLQLGQAIRLLALAVFAYNIYQPKAPLPDDAAKRHPQEGDKL